MDGDNTKPLQAVAPQARQIVEKASLVYMKHTGPSFVGLLIQGSALHGEFVPGCSDIDLKLYVSDDAFVAPGHLSFKMARAIYRDLSAIDPTPFSQIQCYAYSPNSSGGTERPAPGGYRILAGELPVEEETPQARISRSRKILDDLAPLPPNGLLNRHRRGEEHLTRLMATWVWTAFGAALSVSRPDPFRHLAFKKSEAIALVDEHSPLGMTIRAFYRSLFRYYPSCRSSEAALEVIEAGVAVLDAITRWWQTNGSERETR